MGLLDVIELQITQNEQEAVFCTRQRAVGIRDRAITFPHIAIQRVMGEIALHRVGESRQKCHERSEIETGERA